MCYICKMDCMYDQYAYGTPVTCVTQIARKTYATSRMRIPHMIYMTVGTGTGKNVTSGIALVRSCGSSGSPTGDGRHPLPPFAVSPACSLPVVFRCSSGSLLGKLPLAADGTGNRVPTGDGRHRRSRRARRFRIFG